MQHNELGTYDEPYNVVIMEPTLAVAPPMGKLTSLRFEHRPSGTLVAHRLQQYTINALMGRWITQVGYQRSLYTVVWGFGNKAIFEGLADIVAQRYGKYIPRFELWHDEAAAVDTLMADPRIQAVYDSDHDRIARLWRLRGYGVVQGGSP